MYVSGTGKYSEREDLLGVISGNLPGWAKTGTDFFAAADSHERENGRSYREVEFAIPREVADPVLYASQFAEKLLGKDYVFVLGVHSNLAMDGKPNTHGHLMFSERKLDGIERTEEKFFARANKKNPEKGGTAKDREMNSKDFVKKVRSLHKSHAAENGVELDMRNWKERGTGMPEPKIGPAHPRTNLNPVRELKIQTVKNLRYERVENERNIETAFGNYGRFGKDAGRAGNRARKNLSSFGIASQFVVEDLSGIAEIERIGSQGQQRETSTRPFGFAKRFTGISDLPDMHECPDIHDFIGHDLPMLVVAHDQLQQDQIQASSSPDVQQVRAIEPRKSSYQQMKEADAYDKQFREKVQEALDDPRPCIPHEQVEAEFAAERAQLLQLAELKKFETTEAQPDYKYMGPVKAVVGNWLVQSCGRIGLILHRMIEGFKPPQIGSNATIKNGQIIEQEKSGKSIER